MHKNQNIKKAKYHIQMEIIKDQGWSMTNRKQIVWQKIKQS
jgi:hypothetical protein